MANVADTVSSADTYGLGAVAIAVGVVGGSEASVADKWRRPGGVPFPNVLQCGDGCNHTSVLQAL